MTHYHDYKEGEEVWYTLVVNVDPSFTSEFWPQGYWQKYTRKYKTQRRAIQALGYIKYAIPMNWNIKVVPCGRPIPQQLR